MPANWLGKLKATCQNIAVIALLFHYPTFGLPAHAIGLGMLLLATLITLWSGYKYFASYFGIGGIGRVLFAQKKYDEAKAMHEEALDIRELVAQTEQLAPALVDQVGPGPAGDRKREEPHLLDAGDNC